MFSDIFICRDETEFSPRSASRLLMNSSQFILFLLLLLIDSHHQQAPLKDPSLQLRTTIHLISNKSLLIAFSAVDGRNEK